MRSQPGERLQAGLGVRLLDGDAERRQIPVAAEAEEAARGHADQVGRLPAGTRPFEPERSHRNPYQPRVGRENGANVDAPFLEPAHGLRFEHHIGARGQAAEFARGAVRVGVEGEQRAAAHHVKPPEAVSRTARAGHEGRRLPQGVARRGFEARHLCAILGKHPHAECPQRGREVQDADLLEPCEFGHGHLRCGRRDGARRQESRVRPGSSQP